MFWMRDVLVIRLIDTVCLKRCESDTKSSDFDPNNTCELQENVPITTTVENLGAGFSLY